MKHRGNVFGTILAAAEVLVLSRPPTFTSARELTEVEGSAHVVVLRAVGSALSILPQLRPL